MLDEQVSKFKFTGQLYLYLLCLDSFLSTHGSQADMISRIKEILAVA